jgi:hypothetical protein
MTNQIARLLPSIAVGVFASLPFATMPFNAVSAAEECRTAPKGEASAGQHWHYRIEHPSKRHCWFLRDEGETSSRAATSTPARRAASEATSMTETTLTRADADAHAEMPPLQTSVEDDPQVAPSTPPLPSVDTGGAEQTLPKAEQTLPSNGSLGSPQSIVAARWPDQTDAPWLAGVQQPAPASFAVAAASANESTDTDADPTPTAALATTPAATTSEEPPAAPGVLTSPQMLLLITLGALMFTGLTGSAVYLLGHARRRPQRYVGSPREPHWPASADRAPPPWLEPLAIDPARDAEARSLEHLTRVSGIDALLTRLANQSQTGPDLREQES